MQKKIIYKKIHIIFVHIQKKVLLLANFIHWVDAK